MSKAMESIFKIETPEYLRTDRGLEFTNKEMKELYDKYIVKYFNSNDTRIKCAVVERFNRTFKNKMFKYFTANGTRRYIDVIQDLVDSYNNSVHRSIGLRPVDVTPAKESKIFEKLYGFESLRELLKHTSASKLKSGDKVRLAYEKKPFDKSYYPNWTDNIYTVSNVARKQLKPLYKLKESNGEEVKRRFYTEEVQKVTNEIYRVEKIIRRRRRNNKVEYFVEWLNYPNSYNSWIPATDIFDVNGGE